MYDATLCVSGPYSGTDEKAREGDDDQGPDQTGRSAAENTGWGGKDKPKIIAGIVTAAVLILGLSLFVAILLYKERRVRRSKHATPHYCEHILLLFRVSKHLQSKSTQLQTTSPCNPLEHHGRTSLTAGTPPLRFTVKSLALIPTGLLPLRVVPWPVVFWFLGLGRRSKLRRRRMILFQ